MSVPLAYFGVLLIWSTTPLTVKWSAEGAGPLFSVLIRAAIACALCVVWLAAMRQRLPMHRAALRTYAFGGSSGFLAMVCVYWGSRFIPSGLTSMLYGLSPLFTGVFAALWLRERELTPLKTLGIVFALCGLWMIFGVSNLTSLAVLGSVMVLVSVLIHSLNGVVLKHLTRDIPAIATTTGTLLVALPLYAISWWLVDGQVPQNVPARAWWAILYLGVIGSVVAFVLYFYALKRVTATRMSLVTLITPVVALLLGHSFNGERLETLVWIGMALIMGGLLMFEYGPVVRHRASMLWTTRKMGE
ncbi:MAG: EamA family transporter [Gammaproteobacteria bacterium]|nr:EamA family transporter [Gammaproteobacteria bacterium]